MSKELSQFSVEANLARIKAAQAQAWEEAKSVEARRQSLMRQADQINKRYSSDFLSRLDTPPPRPAESSGLAEIEAYVVALRAHCNSVENHLARAVAIEEARLLVAELASRLANGSGSTKTLLSAQGRSSGGEPSPHASSDGEPRERRETEIAKILEGLPSVTAPEMREAIEHLAAEAIATSDEGRSETLALDLRLRVQRLREGSERAIRDADRAATLRARLRGLDGEDVKAVIDDLLRVERREQGLTDALAIRVEETERIARARADQIYAAQVVSEELQRLGYEVDIALASLFAAGGKHYLRKPGLGEYRVAMEIEPSSGLMDMQLARFTQSDDPLASEQKLRDGETEHILCRDLAQLRGALRERGITNRVVRRIAAGTSPVQVLGSPDRNLRQETVVRRTPSAQRKL